MNRIRVLLVDDHALLLDTLSTALNAVEDVEVVGTAVSAGEGLTLAKNLKPDVALLDVELPDFDGIELSRQMRSQLDTRVVMLTGSSDASLFPRAMASGACGYLLKESSLDEVTDAIRKANSGQVVVPERSLEVLMKTSIPNDGTGSDLTDRELEVLVLLGTGTDLRVIAKSLGITWNTARSYVKNVLFKLDAHSQLEAVAKATRLGILGIPTAGESK